MSGVSFAQRLRMHEGRQVDKWEHYGRIYDFHFSHLWTSVKRVLEIGVDHGGSLQIWKRYFPTATIVGLDINPDCKRFEEDRIEIVTGDQTDTKLLESLGEFDIVIEDGSHDPEHQAITFAALYPKTKTVYLIEDCHTRFPTLATTEPALAFTYPGVLVIERPKRIIRGEPSRELRPDEAEARSKYGPPSPKTV